MVELITNPFSLLMIPPIIGFFFILFSSRLSERTIRFVVSSLSVIILGLALFVGLKSWWLNFPFAMEYGLNIPSLHHIVHLSVKYDATSMIFSLLTAFFGFVIIQFSKIYLHKEPGFGRFFGFIFLLMLGMQSMSIADNLGIFFIGWELIGLASFFLIAFYRHKANAIQNALTVFIVYRIGDLGFLFGDLFWHKLDVRGHLQFSNLDQIATWYQSSHSLSVVFLVLGILLAAAAKSGQIPFFFWVPRAMEGPTPSSAIFYGALAIHAGVFLLLRIYPIWSGIPILNVGIGLLGFSTMLFATMLSRIQSSIKAQLAYASIAQVGIMFVELALGLTHLVLFHITMHALLRAYQLIVSQSILNYHLVSETPLRGSPSIYSYLQTKRWFQTIDHSLYLIAFYEGYWESLKSFVMRLWPRGFLMRRLQEICLTVSLSYVLATFFSPDHIYSKSMVLAVISLWFAIIALQTRSPGRSFDYILASVLSAQISAYIWSDIPFKYFFPGVIFVGIFWLACRLTLIQLQRVAFQKKMYAQGLFDVAPYLTWFLVFSVCGAANIPPLPNFFVEEILMDHLGSHSLILPIFIGLAQTINGIAAFYILAKIGMGESLSFAIPQQRWDSPREDVPEMAWDQSLTLDMRIKK